MFNRFKSAIYNVVGSFDTAEGGAVGSLRSTIKFPYSRPNFLQFLTEDEILVTADHGIRPIICPRDISKLPWNSGYSETINAGKSKRNEDQAAIHAGVLTRTITRTVILQNENDEIKKEDIGINTNNSSADPPPHGIKVVLETSEISQNSKKQQFLVSLPYFYFGVFDGHAGWGAAVSAAKQLHFVIHQKLTEVVDLIIPDITGEEPVSDLKGMFWFSCEKAVSPESAIIGALEQSFWVMDEMIASDRLKHQLSGGCTACIALFIMGKVFVSNAGDSRATIAFNGVPVPMSFDFTPETETQRIRKLGARHPELLGEEFTHLEYLRRPLKRDIGKKAAYRDHYMKGWALKTITEDDLKYPLVCGEGKRSRVLATIGVTRGFGDHDLKAQFSALPIKPFLSPEPEVKVFDLNEVMVSDRDVLILGTDGLWDITSNDKAVELVCQSLSQFPREDLHKYRYRYMSAAHDLVLHARGRLKDHNWRTGEDKHATIDDISVFVIPLNAYKEEFAEWLLETQRASQRISGESAVESAIDVVNNQEDNLQENNLQADIPQEKNLQADNPKEEHLEADNPQERHLKDDNPQGKNLKDDNPQEQNLKENEPQAEILPTENAIKENIQANNLQTDNPKKESLQADNLKKENLPIQNMREENRQTENLQEDKLQSKNQQGENLKAENPQALDTEDCDDSTPT